MPSTHNEADPSNSKEDIPNEMETFTPPSTLTNSLIHYKTLHVYPHYNEWEYPPTKMKDAVDSISMDGLKWGDA